MELPIGKKQRKEFWKSHIEASANYSGSIASYCKEHGISKSGLIYHRQNLSKPRNGFAEVKALEVPSKVLEPSLKITDDARITKGPRLPDAQWLAALIRELSR